MAGSIMYKIIIPISLSLLACSCSSPVNNKTHEIDSVETTKSKLSHIISTDKNRYSRGDLSGLTISEIRGKYLSLNQRETESSEELDGLATCFAPNHGMYNTSGQCVFENYASQYMHDPNGWQKDKIIEENKRCSETPNCERDKQISSIKEHLNLTYQQALFAQQYNQGEADAAIRQTCITGGDAQRSGRTLAELTHAYNQVPGLSIMARQLMRSAGQDCWQLSKLGVKDGTELIVPY